jgi:uncharacterized Zn finger protein
MSRYYSGGFPEYISVEDRKKKAEKTIKAMRKKGESLDPIVIEGRTIAKTFWAKAWCQHLEIFKDEEYRLGRGRSYVRSNSVIDLSISNCMIKSQVVGSDCYKVEICFSPIQSEKWRSIVTNVTGKINSLVELLQGKFSKEVMAQMIDVETGLFPSFQEAKITCSCPDYSSFCKHAAATLYAVGNRLDTSPELLFVLRGVDHGDLLKTDSITLPEEETQFIGDLSEIFGIQLSQK